MALDCMTKIRKCSNPGCAKKFEVKLNSGGLYCAASCASAHRRWKCLKDASLGKNVHPRTMKRWLIENNGNKCNECGQKNVWKGKPLVLHLDHIDGDSDNTTKKNCRLLCPNCHSQTPTFGNRGMGRRYKKIAKRNVYLQEYKAKK